MPRLVTSVTVTWSPRRENARHAHVRVWARGGFAGELTVDAEDGEPLAELLIPSAASVEWAADGTYTRRKAGA